MVVAVTVAVAAGAHAVKLASAITLASAIPHILLCCGGIVERHGLITTISMDFQYNVKAIAMNSAAFFVAKLEMKLCAW